MLSERRLRRVFGLPKRSRAAPRPRRCPLGRCPAAQSRLPQAPQTEAVILSPELPPMRTFLVPALTVFLLAAVAAAQEKPKDTAPRGDSPKLLQAQARQVDGKIVIRIDRPVERGAGPLVTGEGIGSLPAYSVMGW